jgi:hypothetical protein
MVGSIANTQEVIDLAHKYNIRPNVVVRPVTELNQIYETLSGSNDSGVRYVLDLQASLTHDTLEDTTDACTKAAPPALARHGKTSLCTILCGLCRMSFCCRCCRY